MKTPDPQGTPDRAATQRGKTLLKGHTLDREGRPFHKSGYAVQFSNGGYGRCSCGELSPWLNSDSARKRWHRRHKDSLR